MIERLAIYSLQQSRSIGSNAPSVFTHASPEPAGQSFAQLYRSATIVNVVE
jgi:hypothetical protein